MKEIGVRHPGKPLMPVSSNCTTPRERASFKEYGKINNKKLLVNRDQSDFQMKNLKFQDLLIQ